MKKNSTKVVKNGFKMKISISSMSWILRGMKENLKIQRLSNGLNL